MIRKALWVHVANYCNCIVYVEHVLLHCLVLFLLNLIQCPYNGIVVMFITKHLFHVHQQVLHGDIFAFIQGVCPFTWVPVETGKDMRAHTDFIILLEEGIHIKMPECVHHFCTWISRLKDRHVQSCRSQPLLPPTPLVALVMMLTACGLTAGGVTIGVQGSPVWQGRRFTSPADSGISRLRQSSTLMRSPCTSCGPGIHCLLCHSQSPSLLGCTPH